MISARILADSKNKKGNRITTFILVMPRIILAEFNTHRAISRNSASSRAIPFEKMYKSVEENPFIPIKWMKDHKGMQGTEYFEGDILKDLKMEWLEGRDSALSTAWHLSQLGLTKQLCNRPLETYMYHTVIATATDWQNFFALRAHEGAEIHMQDLAYKMLKEYNASKPDLLKNGEWHIPYRQDIKISDYLKEIYPGVKAIDPWIVEEIMVRVSTGMCARVSYTTIDEEQNNIKVLNNLDLHDKLLIAGHMSPFEHCAQNLDTFSKYNGRSGNFSGFIQYRQTIKDENRKDERVIKK